MKNLEQIRAKNALNVEISHDAGDSKNIAKKVPTMIMENGIIGAAAFAKESNVKGYASVFENGIIPHLESINGLPGKNTKLEGFIEYLCNANSSKLRQVTAEAIAYLSYLRRFASNRGE